MENKQRMKTTCIDITETNKTLINVKKDNENVRCGESKD